MEQILCIPLSLYEHEDFVIWRGEPTGEYSVQSRHKLLLYNDQNDLQTNYKQFYKKLWNLDLPSKIKITVWRVSRNFFPAFSNLQYRRLRGSATVVGAKTVWNRGNTCSTNVLLNVSV